MSRTVALVGSAILALLPCVPTADQTFKPEDLPVLPPDLPPPLHEAFTHAKCSTEPQALRDASSGTQVAPPRAPIEGLTMPAYPAESRRAGDEGTTTMLILVNEEGRVVRAVVEYSSGHRALDQAALDQARKWRLRPSTLNGAPHCGWGRFATTFRMLGDSEPLIRPEARRLAQIILANDRVQGALSRAPLLQGSATDARVLAEAGAGLMYAMPFAEVQNDYAVLLSANISREDLAALVAFYETPAGVKWLQVQTGIDRAVADRFNKHLGGAACRVLLAQRSLAAHAPADPAATSLPPQFRKALPKILTANKKFCECASQQFARGLGVSDAAGRDKLISDAQTAANCRLAEDVKW